MKSARHLIHALLTLTAIGLSSCSSTRVYVNFTADENGRPADVEVVKVICKDCSEEELASLEAEAIRVVQELPRQDPDLKLEPGISYTLPIDVKKTPHATPDEESWQEN